MPNFYNYTPAFYEWVTSLQTRQRSDHPLVLYGSLDTRARRCLWMCRELEAESNGAFTFRHHDTQFNDKVFVEGSINPNRRMPFLDDGGVHMFESCAINLYLAKKYGKSIAPQNEAEEAACLKWSFWAMTETDVKVWELVITGPARVDPAHPWCDHPVVRGANTPAGPRKLTGEDRFLQTTGYARSALGERRLVREFARCMGALDRSLRESGRDYLAADRFTVADLNVAMNLAWCQQLGWQAFQPFPHVRAWFQRCVLDRPASFSYQHVIPEYGGPMYNGPWKMWTEADTPKAKM